MTRMLVIGIGSLIMTDDGIGARVAGAIESKLREQGIAVLVGETDVQYCFGEIRPDGFLIIIDAMMSGKAPGSIESIPLQNALKSHDKLYSQHEFSLIDTVSLNYPDLQGCFIGIEAAEIGFGFELSAILENEFDQICEKVFKAIIKLREAVDCA